MLFRIFWLILRVEIHSGVVGRTNKKLLLRMLLPVKGILVSGFWVLYAAWIYSMVVYFTPKTVFLYPRTLEV